MGQYEWEKAFKNQGGRSSLRLLIDLWSATLWQSEHFSSRANDKYDEWYTTQKYVLNNRLATMEESLNREKEEKTRHFLPSWSNLIKRHDNFIIIYVYGPSFVLEVINWFWGQKAVDYVILHLFWKHKIGYDVERDAVAEMMPKRRISSFSCLGGCGSSVGNVAMKGEEDSVNVLDKYYLLSWCYHT